MNKHFCVPFTSIKGIQKWKKITYLTRENELVTWRFHSLTVSKTRLSCSKNKSKRCQKWISGILMWHHTRHLTVTPTPQAWYIYCLPTSPFWLLPSFSFFNLNCQLVPCFSLVISKYASFLTVFLFFNNPSPTTFFQLTLYMYLILVL